MDLERSLGARLGPILRSGPSFVSSSPLIRYCLNRRFDHRFFDLFDNFIGYCLDRRFNYRFFDLFDSLINSFDDFIGNCLNRRFNYRFFCLSLCFSSCFNTLTKNFSFFDDLDRRFNYGFFGFFDNLSNFVNNPLNCSTTFRVLPRLASTQLRLLLLV